MIGKPGSGITTGTDTGTRTGAKIKTLTRTEMVLGTGIETETKIETETERKTVAGATAVRDIGAGKGTVPGIMAVTAPALLDTMQDQAGIGGEMTGTRRMLNPPGKRIGLMSASAIGRA